MLLFRPWPFSFSISTVTLRKDLFDTCQMQKLRNASSTSLVCAQTYPFNTAASAFSIDEPAAPMTAVGHHVSYRFRNLVNRGCTYCCG